MTDNCLYYGDNLDVLRRHIPAASIDLVYLDPPFNSKATYNVLFAERNGSQAAAQIKAFGDYWHWDQVAAASHQETVERGGRVSEALQAFRQLLGTSDMMAYLTMMAPRLVELRRVLKSTGSIYLHCDPTASHYLRVLMDGVFGAGTFRNEIIWKRAQTVKGNFGQGSRMWSPNTDTLLFYCMSDRSPFRQSFNPYSEEYLRNFYRYEEPQTGRRYRLISMIGPGGAAKGNPCYEVLGVTRYWRYSKQRMDELIRAGLVVQTQPGTVPVRKQYLDDGKGVAIQSLWDDIPSLSAQARERLGYPTQKPEALLERIISASSSQGDTVLDPFCGCGTTVSVAQRLNRRWIGIDITHLAITLIKHRLLNAFGDQVQYDVIGEPVSVPDAHALAEQDPYQFQWWALGLVGGRPVEERKGADKGIDGRLYFHDGPDGKTKQIVLSVKAGHTGPAHVRDLHGVLDREKAALGVLITMQEPTQPMCTEAADAGFYTSPWGNHPRLQILTIADLLAGKKIDYPPSQQVNVTFKKAPKAKRSHGVQGELDL